ncbi:hypothetical protein [Nocardia carnea]|uniref:hypothetical protein n=1 Tax=Nocardia carnea TaxID=37328 RepID=UPI0024569014|nr:hypothetical protein [Nocardia carnea]
MNDDVDRAAQDDPEWVVWLSQVDDAAAALFTDSLSRVPADWSTPAGKPVGPMPVGVDVYSNEMVDDWLSDAFGYLFPDEDSLMESKNTDTVAQFVAYIGEYFVQRLGGRWVNRPSETVLFGFGPAIYYDWTEDSDNPEHLLFSAAEEGDFDNTIGQAWYSRSVDYAQAHGLPHSQFDFERKHGLR